MFSLMLVLLFVFFFQAEDGIRDIGVTGVQTCALPISRREAFGPQEWGLLAAIAAMWGSSFLFIEIGLEHFGPGVVAFGRVAVGALTLSLLRGSHRPVERGDLPRVALLGAVWMAAPLLLFPIGQQWIDSSLAGMLNGAVPIFAAVTAAILLRRLPASRQLIGIAVGFLGVVGVLWPATRDADATALGASLVLLAVLCYGVAVNIAVPLQHRYGALPVLLRAQLVALVLLAPAALVSLPDSNFAWSSTLAVVALGVIFRDETIAAISLVGTGLVLAGAYLTSRRE